MAPGTKRKSDYKSDDFVVSGDEDDRPSKRGKSGKSTFQASTQSHVDENGDKYWEISKTRRVTVSEFKKNVMVNVREYYEKDGKMLPGKKGISLTIDQYSALIALMPQIEDMLQDKGERVPRPDYGASKDTSAATNASDDREEDEPHKANIDATSDEDEE